MIDLLAIDLTAIGQVISTAILVGGLLYGAVRWLLKANEARHEATEETLTQRLHETESQLTDRIRETREEFHTRADIGERRVEAVVGDVESLKRTTGFLRERTAGLESAVFKRPPIMDEEDS